MLPDDFDITLDLAPAQRGAERVRDRLLDLRRRHDLARFEYTRKVRIAPTEIPHSHPILTLNSFVSDDLSLLSTYLHEQMHWYLTWYSHAHAAQWHALLRHLRERYPKLPNGTAGGAQDEFSTYLHLIVNWLEIESASQFVERTTIVALVGARPFYRWPYRTVIADWEPLGILYAAEELLPFRFATDMSADELKLAGRSDEPPLG